MCKAMAVHNTQTIETSQPSSPRPESYIHVHPGQQGAIAKALGAAQPNTAIILSVGVYTEKSQLIVPSGVSLRCETSVDHNEVLKRQENCPINAACIRVSCGDVGAMPFVSLFSSGNKISNIVFEISEGNRDNRQWPFLEIGGHSDAEVNGCGFLGEYRFSVRVQGHATPKIEECVMSGSLGGLNVIGSAAPFFHKNSVCVSGTAIRVSQHAKGRCTANRLETGSDACIVGEEQSKTLFTQNELCVTKGCAVVVRDSSSIVLAHNNIDGSHLNGMQIGDSATPAVKDNVIKGSRGSGIVLHQSAAGMYLRNRIEGSKLAGVGIRDNAEPYLKDNVICNGEASGVVVLGKSKSVFESNKICNNQGSGVRLTASSNSFFDDNEISSNRDFGFWLQGECVGTLQNNKVQQNRRAGIYVTQQAAPRVCRNVVSNGKDSGILLEDQAKGEYSHNVITKNAVSNVIVGGTSTAVFEDNVITDSPSGGVLCRGESCASLLRNRVEHNGIANVAVLDSAKPTVRGNTVRNGIGRGLVVTGSAGGLYAENCIAGNQTAGMYIGGYSKPTLVQNTVEGSGASGMVIEDWAEGTFSDNVFRDNDSAAVAVQGQSKPVLERTVIEHNGSGGIWLGEQAGGTIKDTTILGAEPGTAWRRGRRVKTKVVQAEPRQTGEVRAPSSGAEEAKSKEIALIFNPGSDAHSAIGLVKLPPIPQARCPSPPGANGKLSARPPSHACALAAS